jgi:hypothetical protein
LLTSFTYKFSIQVTCTSFPYKFFQKIFLRVCNTNFSAFPYLVGKMHFWLRSVCLSKLTFLKYFQKTFKTGQFLEKKFEFQNFRHKNSVRFLWIFYGKFAKDTRSDSFNHSFHTSFSYNSFVQDACKNREILVRMFWKKFTRRLHVFFTIQIYQTSYLYKFYIQVFYTSYLYNLFIQVGPKKFLRVCHTFFCLFSCNNPPNWIPRKCAS